MKRCACLMYSTHYVVMALDSMVLALYEADIAEFRQLCMKNMSTHSMCIVHDDCISLLFRQVPTYLQQKNSFMLPVSCQFVYSKFTA
jgi:hypothetical protein